MSDRLRNFKFGSQKENRIKEGSSVLGQGITGGPTLVRFSGLEKILQQYFREKFPPLNSFVA